MFNKLYGMMNWPLIEGIEYTDIDNPKDVLGQHLIEDGVLIQAFVPEADKVEVKYSGKLFEMFKMDEAGFYAIIVDSAKMINYKLVITRGKYVEEKYDAYSFYSFIDYKEIKKFNAGIAYNAYDFMGAHKCVVSGVSGVRFCVWAPGAIRVSVVGDFNNWDGRIHQMSKIDDTGIFEIFVPEISENALYKYEIKKKGGENLLKPDPYAFKLENKPGDASIITDLNKYEWNDKAWVAARDKNEVDKMPISIYHLSVSDFIKNDEEGAGYRTIAKDVADYVIKTGYTHIELMPVSEYFDEDSLGYITNYFFAPTNRYGTNEDLMYFVDYMHGKGIGVILDWVPTQFGTDEIGMGYFDGSCVYESENPKRGLNPRNGAHMFNYARPEVTNFLLTNAFMWIDKYHFDGLNIVNLAEMLYHDYNRNPGEWESNIYGGAYNLEAIEFLKHFNSIIHKLRKGVITIADEVTGYPNITGEVNEDCLGFDLKWNHEWRNDLMNFMVTPAYLRTHQYNDLSLSMIYQYSDNFIVGYQAPEFINGKAPMIGRMAGDTEEVKFSNLRLALAYSFVHPGKKIMSAGQDMGVYNEWTKSEPIDMELLKVDKHGNVNAMIKNLNKIYKQESALHELDNDIDGFEWINNISANECILTFVRKGTDKEDMLLVVCNFDNVDREDYKIGVPQRGKYKEIFNSDSTAFGGKGFVNSRLKQSKTDECDGREESVRVNVAALSVAIFKFSNVDKKLVDNKTAKENTKKTVKKAEPKKAEEKNAEPKKGEVKKEEAKKTEPKKIATKKTEPEKIATKKAEPKKIATKKTEPEKIATKKAEPKKITTKKNEPEKIETKKTEIKKIATKREEAKKIETKKEEPKKIADKKTETKIDK